MRKLIDVQIAALPEVQYETGRGYHKRQATVNSRIAAAL